MSVKKIDLRSLVCGGASITEEMGKRRKIDEG
jgi:hypothetical protein